MGTLMNHLLARFFVAALALSFGPTVTYIFAQDQPHALHMSTDRASLAQVVALDEMRSNDLQCCAGSPRGCSKRLHSKPYRADAYRFAQIGATKERQPEAPERDQE